MTKNVVAAIRIFSALLLLPVGLKILPSVSKVFPDFKTTPWFVISLLLFLICALVAPVLTFFSALKVDSPTGQTLAWTAFAVGLGASFFPFLGRFVQFHKWVLDEIKVDFGFLVTDPKIFQYLFIVRDLGLIVLLASIFMKTSAPVKHSH
jgi:ABC-type glucose/galactose transport system permease subunit